MSVLLKSTVISLHQERIMLSPKFPRGFSSAFSALTLLAAMIGSPLAKAQDLQPLDMRQVKLGGEMGRRLDATVKNNFMLIDVDKDFLAPFQHKTANDGYVGLGKFIDSAVKFAAYTSDEQVLVRKKHLIDSAIAAQEPDGYLGIFAHGNRMKGLWDVHEMGYVIFGLTSDWHYFQEKKSLEAARKMADYLLAHWKEIPDDWSKQTGIAENVAFTGLDRTMIALARETGEKKYVDFCLHERRLPEWNKDIEIGRRPGIEGHTYAFISRCLALQDLSRLVAAYALRGERIGEPNQSSELGLMAKYGNGELLKQPRKAWDFMIGSGMTITGGCGQWECWSNDQDGRGALGETCSTAYQLRMLDQTQRNGAWVSNFGDLMERTIYNALFAAQSPDGRRIRYYTPFEGKRDYHPTDNYCCPCNFRRIVAELPEMVYYRCESGYSTVVVNLYTPSTTKFPVVAAPAGYVSPGPTGLTPNARTKAEENEKTSLTLRQETDYPNSGKITIFVDPEKEVPFGLDLRIPRWCLKPSIKVNNKEPDPAQVNHQASSGSFCRLYRSWSPGDRVELDLPMEWRFVHGRERQAGRVAVMRGPVLFCLDPLRKENEAFKDWDAADLGRCVLVPESIEGPFSDDSVRPGGMACRIKAFKPGYNCETPDTEFLLTEFPDPDGRAVYFRLRDLSAGVPDELLQPGQRVREIPGL
jgi:uncharacterized protein